MIIGMVVAFYVSPQWRSQSSSLCWEQLSLLCVFMCWTLYHPNLWGVRSFKRLRWHCEIFCLQGGSSYYHRFDCAVWFRDEHHSTSIWWGSFAHEFGWHEVFLFAKRSQRRSLRYLHWNLGWHDCLVSCLDCAAQQSFVLWSHCAVFWRTSHHHDGVALSKKLGITWR